MRLIDKRTGEVVEPGDRFIDFRGDTMVIVEPVGSPPHKPSSTGTVYWVRPGDEGGMCQSSYPSVCGLEWRES